MRLEAGKHTGEAPTPVPCSTPTVSNFPAEASLGDKGQVRRPKEPEERKAGSQSTWPSLASTWLSPLGGLASPKAWVAVTGHTLPGGFLTLWALPQLTDVT